MLFFIKCQGKKQKGRHTGLPLQFVNFEAYRQERGQRDEFRNFFYEGNSGIYVKKAVELAVTI
ncbi:hypothetical protein ES703_48229 [subsurface metagenome]